MSGAPARRLAWLRRVRVGSTNEPKLAAVRAALEPYVDEVVVEGADVESGVSEQPVGFEAIVAGARNRAAAARRVDLECDVCVGIEDGLVRLPGVEQWLNIGAAIVSDGEREGLGLSSAFGYPPELAVLAALQGEPIGDLFDALWARRRGATAGQPSAGREGNVGKLSLGVLQRSEYARHAVVCALLRFLHPDLYGDDRVPGVATDSAPTGDSS